MVNEKLEKFYKLKEVAISSFVGFDDCELELKEIDEELYVESWENNWLSLDAWDYFEKGLLLEKVNLSDKLEIGIDFNVVSNPKTHEVSLKGSKYVTDGEIITSFTLKNGEIVKIGHRKGVVVDDLNYAVENIFKYISSTELVEIVSKMRDEEVKYINGVKIIRLLNFF